MGTVTHILHCLHCLGLQCCNDSILENEELGRVDPGVQQMARHIKDNDEEMLTSFHGAVHRGVSAIQAGGFAMALCAVGPMLG